ncbi:unnamed protein product [Clavelina lepadiformis]|uniref:Uncharacterized protein n=1 Tax=Clavelina lepadiformis TaxID=159417 RepID=A0ABP0GJI8_CLALP
MNTVSRYTEDPANDASNIVNMSSFCQPCKLLFSNHNVIPQASCYTTKDCITRHLNGLFLVHRFMAVVLTRKVTRSMDRCRKHLVRKHRTETAIVWPESLTNAQLRSLPELPTHDSAECFDKLLRIITQSFDERTDNTDMLTSDLLLLDLKPS